MKKVRDNLLTIREKYTLYNEKNQWRLLKAVGGTNMRNWFFFYLFLGGMKMFIDDTRKMCEFREIKIGQVFRFHNDIYMKTNRWESDFNCRSTFVPNAVQLDTGLQASFFDHEIVELLPKAKLVI